MSNNLDLTKSVLKEAPELYSLILDASEPYQEYDQKAAWNRVSKKMVA